MRDTRCQMPDTRCQMPDARLGKGFGVAGVGEPDKRRIYYEDY